VQNVRVAGYLNGKRAVLLIHLRQPGANIIDTVDRIRSEVPQSKPSSQGIDTPSSSIAPHNPRLVSDVERTSPSPSSSSSSSSSFPAQWRATSSACGSVPHRPSPSLYLCGYSLDNLSLMALISTASSSTTPSSSWRTITRHLEAAWILRRTLKGAKEIGFTVLTISISLIAVSSLAPHGRHRCRLFREFAITALHRHPRLMVISLTTHAHDVRLSSSR